jgi:hypothetical protein
VLSGSKCLQLQQQLTQPRQVATYALPLSLCLLLVSLAAAAGADLKLHQTGLPWMKLLPPPNGLTLLTFDL